MVRPLAGSLLCAMSLVLAARLASSQGICSAPYCKCTPDTHPSWTTINCTLPYDKRLDILESDLPETTTDLVITGAEAVIFGTNSLSRLQDARRLRVVGAKLILIRKFAAVNLNIVNFYLDVEACDALRIEERAFTNIKGPLSVTVNSCDFVSIEGQAFSWLLSVDIENVRELKLNSGAFVLDPTAANIGEHGPGLTILLRNLTIPQITSQTFGSSAASVTMEGVSVQSILPEAFSANTYNVMSLVNCTIDLIDREAFAQKSLVNTFTISNTRILKIATGAIKSGVAILNISHSNIEVVESGAINMTVAKVSMTENEFSIFNEKALELYSWNEFIMIRNKFDEILGNAIVAVGANIHELSFLENEIEVVHKDSLGFIGQTYRSSPNTVHYRNNYFGQACQCFIDDWIYKVINAKSSKTFASESYCTIEELLARCFNVPEQNMHIRKFIDSVCGENNNIDCVPLKSKQDSNAEIKNPRFPHKGKEKGLTSRNAKVIGIIIVSAFLCVLIALLFSLIRCMRRRGHCISVKNFLISSNSGCGTFCERMCSHGSRSRMENAGSLSRFSFNECAERHLLNETRTHNLNNETCLPGQYTEGPTITDHKATQTLPEELTKELLESLKEKLDDPNHYAEARETIEHLYELIKVEETCNSNVASAPPQENIYELPFLNTAPRVGKNNKQMISIGTKVPSLEKLIPLSPRNQQIALAHEYFEPKDMAVHLYSEIANYDKQNHLGCMPDVVAEQSVPRGPYLQAKMATSSSPASKSMNNLTTKSPSPQNMSTISSNKSSTSNTSGRMTKRPLPVTPITSNPGHSSAQWQT